MVRLTADLILRSPQYFNAVRERELDLRGNKISAVENLGASEDQYDSIDLSDNEIVKLENFPYLKRLSTLLVNNNRIARIHLGIGASLPKLQTLILTNNRLVNLADLEPLATIANLQTLSLLDNNVTKLPNYRLFVIHKLPKLRLLDFKKVKTKDGHTQVCKSLIAATNGVLCRQHMPVASLLSRRKETYGPKRRLKSRVVERQNAKKQFGTKEAEAEAKKVPAKTFVPGEVVAVEPAQPEEVPRTGPSPEQMLAIKAAIANSQTLEEVARLEKALKTGQLPADLILTGDEDPRKVAMQTDGPVLESMEETQKTDDMDEG